MKLVSVYNNHYHSGTDTAGQSAPLSMEIDIILESIKSGVYEERHNLAQVRLAKSNFILEEERCQQLNLTKQEIQKDVAYQKAYKTLCDLKNKIPRITVSGLFKPEGRSEKNLKEHSSFIDIDIDKLSKDEIEPLKERLANDPYTYAVFKTCGGDGLALIFRIDPTRHLDAYEGISEYLYQNYGIAIDSAHKNPANTRNLSYDPTAYIREKFPETFKKYPKKKKKEEVKLSFVYAKTDFEHCIKQITGQQLDFCPDYESYRDIGFAIANKFGIYGLEYFDAVCQYGAKYDKAKLAKHYKFLCRNPDGKVKIATFFHRCKTFNIEIYSKETKIISAAASMALKSGRTREDVIKNLEVHDGYTKAQTEDIVNQVFDDKIDFISSSGILDDIQSYLKYNYSLKVNAITGKFENYGVEWKEEDFNSCLIDVKKCFDKADAKWTERILFSSYIPKYNPIQDFFKENKDRAPEIKFIEGKPIIPDIIQKLWDSVITRNATYTCKFGTKWLVGAVSTWFGEPSNLELIFAGALEKGKTHFARYILPDQLLKYFAEIKIDGSDTCLTTMCQKALINQNECDGRSNQEEETHRNILDKDVITIRRPYRRDTEDMKRIAALFGSTNKISDVIKDKRGNRRIIVTEVISRNYEMYDAIDKTDLWMAIYALWKAGYKWKILGDEIAELNNHSEFAEEHGMEYELIAKYYEKCEWSDPLNEKLTATDIKVYLDMKTNQKLRPKVVIDELYRMKIPLVEEKENGMKRKAYSIKLRQEFKTIF